jgi:molecular chaperone GrpE (heat shock protein)
MLRFLQAPYHRILRGAGKEEQLFREVKGLSLRAEADIRRLLGLAPTNPSIDLDREVVEILQSVCMLVENVEEHEVVSPAPDHSHALQEAHELAVQARVRALELCGTPHEQESTQEDIIATLTSTCQLLDRLVEEQYKPIPQPKVEVSDGLTPSSCARGLITVRDSVLQAKVSNQSLDPSMLEGLYLKLGEILKDERITEIDESGRFDYDRQKILQVRTTDDPEQDEHVYSTVRPGYMIEGELLRPQEVIVYSYQGE